MHTVVGSRVTAVTNVAATRAATSRNVSVIAYR